MNESYQKWQVWQEAMRLAEAVCRLDLMEVFNNQIKRSAVSVPANIAEGVARGGGAVKNFLKISRGSCAETETFIILAQRLGLITEETSSSLLQLTQSIQIQLSALIDSINKSIIKT